MSFIDDFNKFKGTLSQKDFKIYLDGVYTNLKLRNGMTEQSILRGDKVNKPVLYPIEYLDSVYGEKNCLTEDGLYGMTNIDKSCVPVGINCAVFIKELRTVHMFSNAYIEALASYDSSDALGEFIRDKTRRVFVEAREEYLKLIHTSYSLCSRVNKKFTGMLLYPTGFEGLNVGEYNKRLEENVKENNLNIYESNINFVIKLFNSEPYRSDIQDSSHRTLGIHKYEILKYLTNGNFGEKTTLLLDQDNLLLSLVDIMVDNLIRDDKGTELSSGPSKMFTSVPISMLNLRNMKARPVTYIEYLIDNQPIIGDSVVESNSFLRRLHHE